MSFELPARIPGLQPHRQMQDAAGKGAVAADKTASETGKISFSELLSKKIGRGPKPPPGLMLAYYFVCIFFELHHRTFN